LEYLLYFQYYFMW